MLVWDDGLGLAPAHRYLGWSMWSFALYQASPKPEKEHIEGGYQPLQDYPSDSMLVGRGLFFKTPKQLPIQLHGFPVVVSRSFANEAPVLSFLREICSGLPV